MVITMVMLIDDDDDDDDKHFLSFKISRVQLDLGFGGNLTLTVTYG